MYFNKSIIFKNIKSQAIATILHLQKIYLFAKTRAECQCNDPLDDYLGIVISYNITFEHEHRC